LTLHLKATGVSKGIGIGNATIIPRGHIHVTQRTIHRNQLPGEKKRYQRALKEARHQLGRVRKQIPENLPTDIDSFIDAHLLMLDDPALVKAPVEIMQQKLCNSEWALEQQYNTLIQTFEDIDDPYLKTRRDDIEHVVSRIQRILMNEAPLSDIVQEQDYSSRIIIIDDLSPAETVSIQQRGVAGFITEYGGPLSHTAILARSLGIPAVVGLQGARKLIRQGEHVIIDGENNAIITSPDKRVFSWYKNRQRDLRRRLRTLAELKDKPAKTIDGITIKLQANIELPDDIKAATKAGCSGVGLFRTEYLFMNRDDAPTEDEQFSAYRSVVRRMKGAPVTIRTLDLGADKQVDSGRSESSLPNNPALGLRAIRLCLQDQELFHTQLRAILRASAYGDIRIMIPMISTTQEIKQVRSHLDAVRAELRREKIKFSSKIPLGTMIEVPAAAISASMFAAYCDFLSIGTNDLIQYTLAIDRVDDSVNYLYDPMHPAILTLVKMTIEAGRKAGIPVSMCGEMAGDTQYTRLLLGLGLTEFSMHPASLLEVKEIIKHTEIEKLKKPVKKLLRAHDTAVIHDQLHRINLL